MPDLFVYKEVASQERKIFQQCFYLQWIEIREIRSPPPKIEYRLWKNGIFGYLSSHLGTDVSDQEQKYHRPRNPENILHGRSISFEIRCVRYRKISLTLLAHAKKSRFITPKNAVWEFFRFASGMKKFSRRNGKILAPLFQKTRTAFRSIPAPE